MTDTVIKPFTVSVKSLDVAKAIAKVLRVDAPEAASLYLKMYGQRQAIEEAALMASYGPVVR